MNKLTEHGSAVAAIVDFLDKWKPEEVNEQLMNMLIETCSSAGASAYDLAAMATLVRDVHKLSIDLHTIKKTQRQV